MVTRISESAASLAWLLLEGRGQHDKAGSLRRVKARDNTGWEGGPAIDHLGRAESVEDAIILGAWGPAEPGHLDGFR